MTPRRSSGGNCPKIRRQKGRDVGGQGGGIFACETANAIAPFGGSGRFITVEAIKAGAGVGINYAEGCRFALQSKQHTGKHSVLHDIGEIAGMVGMAVVHLASLPFYVIVRCSRRSALEAA